MCWIKYLDEKDTDWVTPSLNLGFLWTLSLVNSLITGETLDRRDYKSSWLSSVQMIIAVERERETSYPTQIDLFSLSLSVWASHFTWVRMYASFSSSDYTIFLNTILRYLYRFGGLILIVGGTIGSVISLFVALEKNRRAMPSSIYSVARQISNLLYIYLSLMYFTLALGFDINPSSYNLVYCRFSIYVSFVFEIVSPYYLILSFLERRHRRNTRLACLLCLAGTVFWMLFHSHSWFFATIIQTESNYFYCYLQTGLYSILVTYYSLVIKGLLVPIVLVGLSYWLMKTLHHSHRRVNVPWETSEIRASNDRESSRILIKDMIMYLIFNALVTTLALYELVTEEQSKNLEHIEIEHFIRYIGWFAAGLPFCLGFYTNLCVSKTFRQQVKELFRWKRCFDYQREEEGSI